MSEDNLTKKRNPEPTSVYTQNPPFDNSFVAMDNPDDAEIKQYGNGTTMAKEDNPDDVETKQI